MRCWIHRLASRGPLLGAAVLLLGVCPAHGDLLPPGFKDVAHDIVFTGLDRFPEREFYLVPSVPGLRPVQRVAEGEPLSFYKLLTMTLYAAERGSLPDPEALHEQATGLPRCDTVFSLRKYAPVSDPVSRRLSRFRIDSVSGSRIAVTDLGTMDLDAKGHEIDRSIAGLLRGPTVLSALALAALAFLFVHRQRAAA